jgi:glycosyltransferase 2 family protein
MTQGLKNVFSFLMRFGLSAVLLVWLFTRIDFKHMWEAVRGADMNYMLAAGLVYFGINFIIMWRWMILMRSLDLNFSKFTAMRWFFIGLFSNLFLPSSVGGDVIKGMGLAKVTGHKPKVFASIVLDRLIGFTGIVLVASVAFLTGRKILQDTSIVLSISIMAGVSLLIVTVLFSHRIFSWTTRVFQRWPRFKNGLMALHYDVVLMKGKQKEVVMTIALSIVAQIILAFEFYLTAKGMHQDIALIYFIIFSPLVCVVTALPSIGGLGVREVGWVYFLSKVGVSQGVALGLSLINFAFMVAVGLLGGVLYVTTLSSGRVQYHQASAQLKRAGP